MGAEAYQKVESAPGDAKVAVPAAPSGSKSHRASENPIHANQLGAVAVGAATGALLPITTALRKKQLRSARVNESVNASRISANARANASQSRLSRTLKPRLVPKGVTHAERKRVLEKRSKAHTHPAIVPTA